MLRCLTAIQVGDVMAKPQEMGELHGPAQIIRQHHICARGHTDGSSAPEPPAEGDAELRDYARDAYQHLLGAGLPWRMAESVEAPAWKAHFNVLYGNP